ACNAPLSTYVSPTPSNESAALPLGSNNRSNRLSSLHPETPATMRRHLNTLFITLEGAYLRKDGSAIEVRHEGETKLRIPLHNLDGICCFGWDTTASAALMAACADANVALPFHSPHGKLLASAPCFTSGHILLRRAQYRHADDPPATAAIARNLVAATIANCRTVLLRGTRDHGDRNPEKAAALLSTSDRLSHRMR